MGERGGALVIGAELKSYCGDRSSRTQHSLDDQVENEDVESGFEDNNCKSTVTHQSVMMSF